VHAGVVAETGAGGPARAAVPFPPPGARGAAGPPGPADPARLGDAGRPAGLRRL